MTIKNAMQPVIDVSVVLIVRVDELSVLVIVKPGT